MRKQFEHDLLDATRTLLTVIWKYNPEKVTPEFVRDFARYEVQKHERRGTICELPNVAQRMRDLAIRL